MMVNSTELELFLDESGRFTETNPGTRDRRAFPSQLAGVLAPRGELTTDAARDILRVAHEAASLPYETEVHGNELFPGDAYDRLISSVLEQLRARGWQPVRLVNEEAVSWGDRVTTYTAMVAELVVRVVELQTARGKRPHSVDLLCAVVLLGEDDHGRPEFLEQEEYDRRLREQWAFAGIRKGSPRMSSQLSLNVTIASARLRPELQICDLISNASHSRFKKCSESLRRQFEESFGDFDQTLVIRSVTNRVDEYLREGSIGLALRSLLEARDELEAPGPVAARLRERLGESISSLATLDAPWRTVQLQALTSWCEQVVEQSRQLELGAAMLRWLLTKVEAPLRARLGTAASAIDWFAFALHRLTLTAANHRGQLQEARAAADALDRLVPRLAGHWEHATILMQGFVAQAVHFTDCKEYDRAAKLMALVARYYGDLSTILVDAMPDVFPVRVRSELRGQALGTGLQAETYLALSDPNRITAARELSEAAIDEFEAESDKLRQYQYRSHLEVVARAFPGAREYLGRSLGLEAATHDSIGRIIAALDPPRRGFPLLHWFRLGAACCLADDPAERAAFLAALDSSRFAESSWISADSSDYPAHGIRRSLAVIFAARGNHSEALRILERLRSLVLLDDRQSLFVLVLAAAQAEVASLLIEAEPSHAKRLLDDSKRPGVKQLVHRIQRMPQLGRFVTGWEVEVDRAISTRSAASLLALARTVPY